MILGCLPCGTGRRVARSLRERTTLSETPRETAPNREETEISGGWKRFPPPFESEAGDVRSPAARPRVRWAWGSASLQPEAGHACGGVARRRAVRAVRRGPSGRQEAGAGGREGAVRVPGPARPGRDRQVLHGPGDRLGDGPPGGRVAGAAGAGEGRRA